LSIYQNPNVLRQVGGCDTFQGLFSNKITIVVAQAVAEAMMVNKGKISITQDAIAQFGHILSTLGESPASQQRKDEIELSKYRGAGVTFHNPDEFFARTLSQIESSLVCLRHEDYVLVRKFRMIFENAPVAARKLATTMVCNFLAETQKNNPRMMTNQIAKFFPGYDPKSSDRTLNLTTFFDTLEQMVLTHVERNPLYPNIPWSLQNIPNPQVQEAANMVDDLMASGFAVIDNFGHGENPPKTSILMRRTKDVKGIGLFRNESFFVSSDAASEVQKTLEEKLAQKFIEVCQGCFLDPRIARIVLTGDTDRSKHGTDIIFDEIAVSRVTPENQAHPLCMYKVGKL
jgi:hypothetical protein